MTTVYVEIQGTAPLIARKYDMGKQYGLTPREAASAAAYRAEDGTFYFPSVAVTAAMSAAAKGVVAGSLGAKHATLSKGMAYVARQLVPGVPVKRLDRAAGHLVSRAVQADGVITILRGSEPAKDFRVTSRHVRVPGWPRRVHRYLPCWDTWGAAFDLRIDDRLLQVHVARRLLRVAGLRIGIGELRKEHGGPLGTFRVSNWEVLEEERPEEPSDAAA